MTRAARPAPWLVLGAPARTEALRPLIDLRGRQGPIDVIAGDAADLSDVLSSLRGDTQLLVVEDPSRPSCRHRCGAPIRPVADGTAVVGWLRGDRPVLEAYAARACVLDARRGTASRARPLVLLGPRERRYQALMDVVEAGAHERVACFRWTAERIRATPLAAALGCGLGVALYAGHGVLDGWLAYGGLSGWDLAPAETSGDATIGLVISLACHTGAAGGDGGLADALVASAAAAAVLAPVAETLHAATRTLAPIIVDALADAPPTLCRLLRTLAAAGHPLDGYAVVGDPAITIVPATTALDACRDVVALAPEATLPIATDAWRYPEISG